MVLSDAEGQFLSFVILRIILDFRALERPPGLAGVHIY
jgi:hypothetical protein